MPSAASSTEMRNALVPKPPLAPQTYVRLTVPQHEEVSAMAEAAGVTYSEAIRQLVAKALSIP